MSDIMNLEDVNRGDYTGITYSDLGYMIGLVLRHGGYGYEKTFTIPVGVLRHIVDGNIVV
jgi:hypothetical protein